MDLIQAVREIGDWRGLCLNLKVDEATMNIIAYSSDGVHMKKTECLKAYFDANVAKWSEVVNAVASHPINNKRIAKNIARAYGVDTSKDKVKIKYRDEL